MLKNYAEGRIPSFEPSLGALQCPGCAQGYLHHQNVEVFNRGEDQETGHHVLVHKEGRPYLFEVKVDRNKPTPLQTKRLEQWSEAGAIARPVRSLEEVLVAIARPPAADTKSEAK